MEGIDVIQIISGLQNLIYVLGSFFLIVIIMAIRDNLRLPGKVNPWEIEYMNMKFNGKRFGISFICASLLMVLSIVINPRDSFTLAFHWRLLYFTFVCINVGIIIFTLDQLILLAAIFGVYISNFFKKSAPGS